MSETTAVIPGPCEAGNPEPTSRGAAFPIPMFHPVVGSRFSLREPRNDRGTRR